MSSDSPQSSSFDFRSMAPLDQAVLGTGVLAFIASFALPWYGASFKGVAGFSGASSSINAWHSYSTLAMLLILAATLVAAAQVFARGNLPEIPIGYSWVVAGLSVLGTVLYVIRTFTLKSGSSLGFSYGVKWGGYVLMVLVIAQAVVAVMRALGSGEAKPWENHGGAASAPPAA